MTQQWYRTETVINKGTTKEVHLPLSPLKPLKSFDLQGFFILADRIADSLKFLSSHNYYTLKAFIHI